MKKTLALVLFAFACNLTFAQTDENRKAVFHFSFFSPVGTNEMNAQFYNSWKNEILHKIWFPVYRTRVSPVG